jgi:hypothetical protein
MARSGPAHHQAQIAAWLGADRLRISYRHKPGPAQSALYSPVASYTTMERNVSVSPPQNTPTVPSITGTKGTVTGLTPGRSHIWYVAGVDVYGNASP